jgi:FlaA1/EpsC-like NDP-sugar epimerase
MPMIDRSRRNQILSILRQHHLRVRSLPDLADLAQGKISLTDIHELDIADLLGREPVQPDSDLLSSNIRGKVVALAPNYAVKY